MQVALKDRILRSSSISPPSSIIGVNLRPTKYKDWTETKLWKAFEAVQGGMSVRRAAEAYGVPRSTLQDRASGRTQFGTLSGPPKYLDDNEESELVEYILGCAAVGYAKSKQEILAIVRNVVVAKGKDGGKVTDGWWTSFKKRHGNLALRSAEPVSYARAISMAPDIIQQYYDELEPETLLENILMDKACQIYNLDETGMCLDPNPPKVVTLKGTKHATSITTGNKTQITVIACCYAGGRALPPMVIFDRKSLKPEWTLGEVPGTMYGLSSNGWSDSELFDLWFNNVFLAYAEPLRPLLLIVDGHSTHYTPSVIRKAAEEQVVMFCLPLHTTHRTQPLDKGVFGPLKTAWRNVCKDFLSKNPDRVITRREFSGLLCQAWEKSMTMTNIRAGFRVTGIHPFNRSALSEVDSNSSNSPEKNRLKYIPLLTPSRRDSASSSFTVDEERLFEARYVKWLEKYHPETARDVDGSFLLSPTDDQGSTLLLSSSFQRELSFTDEEDVPRFRHTTLTKTLLNAPKPTLKYPTLKDNNSVRVLTSIQNLKRIEEREKEKEEKEKLKQERMEQRELKKKEKLQKKEEMKIRREQKQQQPKTKKKSAPIDDKVNKPVKFTTEEWNRFSARVEEGYDFPQTGRYALWLRLYYPELTDYSLDGTTSEDEVIFTDQEWELFDRRVEEGYDLPPSGRYLMWLRSYHPEVLQAEVTVSDNEQEDSSLPVTTVSKRSRKPPLTRSGAKSSVASAMKRTTPVESQVTVSDNEQEDSSLPVTTVSKRSRKPPLTRSGAKSSVASASKVKTPVESQVPRMNAVKGSTPSLCVRRRCVNSDEVDWVSCDSCQQWYHCVCVGIPIKLAEKHSFVCCD